MPRFETTHRLPYSTKAMFELVADVDSYPQFVPLCERMEVRATRQEGPRTILLADMTVGYRFVRETFTSRVVLDPETLQITAECLQGPFKTMTNCWTFEADGPDHCRVGFNIAYEFKNRALASLMGSLFDRVFSRFASAFERRADEIYAGP